MKPWTTLLRRLGRTIAPTMGSDRTDGELLEAYLQERDAAAFAMLVERHGPMVLGVCRRVLRNEADADDAFQATFLVLVRKAAAVQPRSQVGNWLYGVAQRTAMKARAMIATRQRKERAVVPSPPIVTDASAEQVLLVEHALAALPDKYRAPLLLCSLEGKTLHEAARQLGWPQGTVACRVARGRELLAKRLVRQGVISTSSALWPVGLATAQVPPALLETVLQGFMNPSLFPSRSLLWAEGVIHAMNTARLLTVSLVCVLFLGGGLTLALLISAFLSTPTNASQTHNPAPHTESIVQERAINHMAWQSQYLPRQQSYRQEYQGKWLVIVGGQLLPTNEGGKLVPANTLAEADAVARKAAPHAKHRYLFQIGVEGDVMHQMGVSGESNRLGRAFVPNGVQNYVIDVATGRVWFKVNNKEYEVGVTGAHEGAPYVAPQLSAPLAAQGRSQKMYLATGIDAIAVLTSTLASELSLEQWEIPGQAALAGVKLPCRRAYVRFRWQEPRIDVALPIVIWDGHVPLKEEVPPRILIR